MSASAMMRTANPDFGHRPISTKPSAIRIAIKNFDWKVASVVLIILTAAAHYWLSKHYVEIERYEKDQTKQQEAYDKDQKNLAKALDRIEANQIESQRDIKHILERTQ